MIGYQRPTLLHAIRFGLEPSGSRHDLNCAELLEVMIERESLRDSELLDNNNVDHQPARVTGGSENQSATRRNGRTRFVVGKREGW